MKMKVNTTHHYRFFKETFEQTPLLYSGKKLKIHILIKSKQQSRHKQQHPPQ